VSLKNRGRKLILFARECFVEEGDKLLDVELNESKVKELDLCLIHFEKVIEFEINLKERTRFLCIPISPPHTPVETTRRDTLVIKADYKSPRHRR